MERLVVLRNVGKGRRTTATVRIDTGNGNAGEKSNTGGGVAETRETAKREVRSSPCRGSAGAASMSDPLPFLPFSAIFCRAAAREASAVCAKGARIFRAPFWIERDAT